MCSIFKFATNMPLAIRPTGPSRILARPQFVNGSPNSIFREHKLYSKWATNCPTHSEEYDTDDGDWGTILQPSHGAVWHRGSNANITWSQDELVAPVVKIELRRRGSDATTIIAQDAPNTGTFHYKKVPWGMPIDSHYFVCISSTGDYHENLLSDAFSIRNA